MVRFLAAQELAKRAAPPSAPSETETQAPRQRSSNRHRPSPDGRRRHAQSTKSRRRQRRLFAKASLTDVVEARRRFRIAHSRWRPICRSRLRFLSSCPPPSCWSWRLLRRDFPLEDRSPGAARHDGIVPDTVPAVFLFSTGYAASLGVHGALSRCNRLRSVARVSHGGGRTRSRQSIAGC